MGGKIDITMPAELEGTKAVVRSWLKAVGDTVRRDEPLVELETDKVTTEVPSPADGVLLEILLGSDAEAEPGALLGRLGHSAETRQTGRAEPAEALPSHSSASQEQGGASTSSAPTERGISTEQIREHRLSPAVRRAICQHSLDPAAIRGTGRNGRITRADVDAHVAARTAAPSSGSRIVPHDRMRRLIADNMLASVTTAPHVTAVFEADFSAIIAHRARHKAAYERDGISLTYTAYIVAACVAAMRAVPVINSRWHADHLEIFEDANIGIGTALGDKGLVVPVVHRAQQLSLQGIAARLHDLTARARSGQLKAADMKDGSFTISNHGVSGSLVATPIIIQQPQSAILGVGKLEKRVVVREVDGVDTIQIRPMAFVSLTIDHRVVDGHQTNAWLTAFVQAIESFGG
ncbi:dihydrolipoamide succinyltransferase [Sphingomonas sp. MAH-20]|uniref:Dihydrolipoamide acetyltransferase component of pyruvate dehydrogenase complex n=1 Tax=Sphingomonas horti TaxID=2682842 RepID=A0A6I4IWA2_9SPHN|nr:MULTISPECIES: dihydrolipoamide acetyltransferase family protein [Sphingomonas]MBA2920175.1 2-oxo acid dehydrogenase subunit E2 [Sphingomonas sp. CGMCC 1.13658]MVO76430.1 dihydrolipoamide succinyltransferase [Sphingomonas horti]